MLALVSIIITSQFKKKKKMNDVPEKKSPQQESLGYFRMWKWLVVLDYH